MKFSTSEMYNAAVFSFKGRLVGGPEAEEFHQAVAKFLNEDKKNIIVDLSDVKFVNSTGIGNVVRAFSTVKDAGGQLKLSGVGNSIEGLLSITKLNQIFQQFPTAEEAAKSFTQ